MTGSVISCLDNEHRYSGGIGSGSEGGGGGGVTAVVVVTGRTGFVDFVVVDFAAAVAVFAVDDEDLPLEAEDWGAEGLGGGFKQTITFAVVAGGGGFW